MHFRIAIIVALVLSALPAEHINAEGRDAVRHGSPEKAPEDSLADQLTRAAQGDAIAQAIVGQRYYTGDGVAKNPARAFEWLLQAAEQGHAGAQIAIALMYARGHGVRKNSAQAKSGRRNQRNREIRGHSL